jgi:glycosyltransferase involved in cell wall biosynthesis
MKIAIIGPYPPPYGGISVHIQRLEALLKQDGHDAVIFSNMTVKTWLVAAFGKWFNYDVVHFHDTSGGDRVLIGLMGVLGLHVILTIHGDSLKNQLAFNGWFKRSLLRFSIRHISHIVCVKAAIRDVLMSLRVEPSRASIINAYLPPALEQEETLPDSIGEFVNAHSPLVVTNGFGVIPGGRGYRGGQLSGKDRELNLSSVPLSTDTDLYGLEMTIDLCTWLVKDYPQLGCLFFLAQIGNQARYDELVEKISQLELNEHFRFVIGESFASTLKRATIFVRPTFEDGYGISVAESLYFGVPALASDVCEREKGALIFKCGDMDDFYRCAKQVLDNYETIKQTMQEIKPISGYEPLLAVYQRVANKR